LLHRDMVLNTCFVDTLQWIFSLSKDGPHPFFKADDVIARISRCKVSCFPPGNSVFYLQSNFWLLWPASRSLFAAIWECTSLVNVSFPIYQYFDKSRLSYWLHILSLLEPFV
jgi:hypothetical protein